MGTFYEGDSYIVLHSWKSKTGNTMNYTLHYWLGNETSNDERGLAAVFTVQLDDDVLFGKAIQIRETQGHESKEFLQLFKSGVMYKKGGVGSGFNKVEDEVYQTRLFHILGNINVRVVEAPLSVDSLNEGDSFVLDTEKKVYVWNGPACSLREKMKALDVTQSIVHDMHNGAAKVITLDSSDMTSDDAVEFLKLLNHPEGTPFEIKSAQEGEAEEKTTDGVFSMFSPPKLFKFDFDAGAATEITDRPLSEQMLQEDGSFFLIAAGQVFVWVGSGVDSSNKPKAMQGAQELLKTDDELPTDLPVKMVKQGLERPLFKQNFPDWGTAAFLKQMEKRALTVGHANGAAPPPDAEPDMEAVVEGNTGAPANEGPKLNLDEMAGGTTKIWRVEDFEKVEWPEEKYGQFYSGDCFLVLYTYTNNANQERQIIYFWQGQNSSQDERAASAMLAASLDQELGRSPVLVRVIQNKEPIHFLAIFDGKMFVHKGGKASGFKNLSDKDSYDTDGVYLYQVMGQDEHTVRAVQVDESASMLNSGDSYVLVAHNKCYNWHGTYASPEEREIAENVSKILVKELELEEIEVKEGEEPDEFWEALGGKTEYAKFSKKGHAPSQARLFQISDASVGGRGISVEEIFDFSQQDLNSHDVMMLDTYYEVFLWMGRSANENERTKAVEVAMDYIKAISAIDGRDPETPITKVKQGHEIPMFTMYFVGWDPESEKEAQSYDDRVAEMQAKYKVEEEPTKEEREFQKVVSQVKDSDAVAAMNAKAEEEKKADEEKKQVVEDEPEPEKKPLSAIMSAFQEKAKPKPKPKPKPKQTQQEPITPPQISAPELSGKPIELNKIPGQDEIPYDELKDLKLEDGIDPSRKELYLSDDEFQKLFKMDKDDFQGLPKWKQQNLKKGLHLF
eukprot:TRINITY_DN3640_c0_g4_i2.p1 TRINITY_DN3640_c0_g4~~TRINITY_DN3640_c0_g4_i2.p1  ORF type:complete len:918 (-),score=215.37 TRINITY_DN3640_c0_g4_i2:1688-4390(-)